MATTRLLVCILPPTHTPTASSLRCPSSLFKVQIPSCHTPLEPLPGSFLPLWSLSHFVQQHSLFLTWPLPTSVVSFWVMQPLVMQLCTIHARQQRLTACMFQWQWEGVGITVNDRNSVNSGQLVVWICHRPPKKPKRETGPSQLASVPTYLSEHTIFAHHPQLLVTS